ncbi:MAG: patatin-like phospholipase family protein [Arenibacterium sp.]
MFDQFHSNGDSGSMRVLSVSGGGLLGVIPAAFLVRYEALGKAAYGASYRLNHSFDLVGGTSTGAVIATGLALGMSADQIAGFYLRDVPKGFRRRAFRLPGWHDMMDADLVEQFYQRHTKGRLLRRSDLACDLCVVTKNATSGQVVAMSSLVPQQTPELPGAALSHEPVPLNRLLRASTAVPGMFAPVKLPIGPAGEDHICIDGGLSPFNTPALLLAKLARAANHAAGGVDVLTLGTGNTTLPRHSETSLTRAPAGLRLLRALKAMIRDSEMVSDAMLQTIASEPGAWLSYRKIDMPLDDLTLEKAGLTLTGKARRALRDFANPRGKAALFQAALRYAGGLVESALPLTAAGARTLDSFASSGTNTKAKPREYAVNG